MSDTSKPDRVQSVPMESGLGGIHQTINAMSKMALGEYGAASPIIRAKAISIVRAAKVPENDKLGEIIAIHEWVKKHLRYVHDPNFYELLTYPETLLERADGDCDDHVILEAALLASIGFSTRFITLRRNPSKTTIPEHVFMAVYIDQEWMYLDPIVKDKPAGWAPIDEAPFNGSEDFLTVYPPNTPNGVTTPMHIPGMFVGGFLMGVVVVNMWRRYRG